MAIYRTVAMSFWTDSKIADDFTPDEKLMYLYLLTNPHTKLCGCYEVTYRQIAYEIGFDKDTVADLMNRLIKVHDVIRYSEETKEVILLNLHKYSWTKSDKFRSALAEEINEIKDVTFRAYLTNIFNGEMLCIDTVSENLNNGEYGIDTYLFCSVTDTVSDTVTVTDTVKEIIDYLNTTCGTKYHYDNKETVKKINARLNDGFTVDDFKTVIYKKARDWIDSPKMCKYLRPQTLFSGKFEGYLNEREPTSATDRWDTA